jgi:hypothetical protein
MKAGSFLLAVLAAIAIFTSASAHAQATRTWVSGVGDDVNPCSRTAPCKTFAGAISKTAAAGEISVLDPGGFGAVTITKSISIVAEGAEGGLLATLTNGIIINSASAVVNIRGLIIEGGGSGLSGIRVLQAASVHIEKCLIRGFRTNASSTSAGIEIVPSASSPKVMVVDSSVSENLRGIIVQPSGAGAADVVLARVTVKGSGGAAIRSTGAASRIWLSQSIVTGNATGLSPGAGGTINSYGNNVIANNTTDGAPTNTLPLQ